MSRIYACISVYYWESLECELCKTAYPCEIRRHTDNKFVSIIEYEVPASRIGVQSQYLVLESLSSSASKVIYVVNMEKNVKIYLGRG